MELQIRKQLNAVFKHIIINGQQINEVIDPRLYAYISNNQLTIDYGTTGLLSNFTIGNISFYDDTGSGSEVTFNNFDELIQTLSNANYPYFQASDTTVLPVVSEVNSSTNNLNAGNSYTFTGQGELTRNADVLVTLFMDQDASLLLQFSQDNINWDSTITKEVTSGFNEFTTAVKGIRYFRVVVSTDSLTTSVFRLQTEFGTYRQGNTPLNSSISLDADAIITRPSDFYNEVNLERRNDVVAFKKFGYNEDVDITDGDAVVWSQQGSALPFVVDVAETIDVNSTDPNDTDGGTGCQGIVIFGINQNREQITEVILLNGTTAVTSINQFFGINRMVVFRSGSERRNAGIINASQTTSGNLMAQMPVGDSTTQQCIYYVGANRTALIDYIYLSTIKLVGGGNPEVVFKLNVFSYVSNTFYEIWRTTIDAQRENNLTIELDDPLPVTEQTIIYLTASTDTNDTQVSARFHLLDYLNV